MVHFLFHGGHDGGRLKDGRVCLAPQARDGLELSEELSREEGGERVCERESECVCVSERERERAYVRQVNIDIK